VAQLDEVTTVPITEMLIEGVPEGIRNLSLPN
jgi:hypothetical protein